MCLFLYYISVQYIILCIYILYLWPINLWMYILYTLYYRISPYTTQLRKTISVNWITVVPGIVKTSLRWLIVSYGTRRWNLLWTMWWFCMSVLWERLFIAYITGGFSQRAGVGDDMTTGQMPRLSRQVDQRWLHVLVPTHEDSQHACAKSRQILPGLFSSHLPSQRTAQQVKVCAVNDTTPVGY